MTEEIRTLNIQAHNLIPLPLGVQSQNFFLFLNASNDYLATSPWEAGRNPPLRVTKTSLPEKTSRPQNSPYSGLFLSELKSSLREKERKLF